MNMKERPILFSAPMVRALLAGTKTQTRRDAKFNFHFNGDRPLLQSCPYGQPGDRLWVREAFVKVDGQTQPWIETDYRATYTHGDRLGDLLGIKRRWTPSIHMPRAASRITLEIVGVRVERLQDISEQDATAEGARLGYGEPFDPANTISDRRRYELLWEQINGPGSWDANPFVWVVEFKRVEQP